VRLTKSYTFSQNLSDSSMDVDVDMDVEEKGMMESDLCRSRIGSDYGVPLLSCVEDEGLRFIEPWTACSLVDGTYNNGSYFYDRVVFVDCRFDYEYYGGSILNAINMKPVEIEEKFITNPIFLGRICVVFFCEFSSKRGPSGYRTLREADRKSNFDIYPELSYPEVYVLQGGYKRFYEYASGKGYCYPDSYCSMSDPRFNGECQTNIKERKLLTKNSRRSLCLSQSCGSIDFS